MKLRVSIRYKMLMVISAVLLLAMGTYLYLATSLFTQDKLAYIYDINSSMVESLSEQTRANVSVMVRELTVFTREATSADDPKLLAANLFANDRDVVHIEIYATDAGGEKRLDFVSPERLESVAVREQDLEQLHKRQPVPVEALVARPGSVFLRNISLPPDAALLSLAVSVPTYSGTVVVVCDFLHQRLLRVFGESRLYETYLVDARGTVLAHPDASKVLDRMSLAAHPLVRAALESEVDRGVQEVQLDSGEVLLGGFAKVGLGHLTVISQVPKRLALQASRELIRRSILFAVAIIIAAFIVSIFFSRVLTAPIRKLNAATRRVGRGEYDVDPGVHSGDEIGDLAVSFKEMAHAIKGTQAQLVRSEKLAAFGQLGAGITHEVKNPMTGILGFAQIAQLKLDDPDKVRELLQMIEREAKRSKDILVNFLKFARQDNKEMESLDLNQVVQEASKIVNHQLMINQVQLELELAEGLKPVFGNAGEIQQVLLNLCMNAQQAMTAGGVVKLRTKALGESQAAIEIEDNGPGMDEATQHRIFDPFFTTKPAGEGTGLGLSISYRIVQDHSGDISFKSKPGEGTTFTITLPVQTA